MLTLSTSIQRTTSAPAGPPSPPERPKSVLSETWTTERIEQLKRGFDAGLSCAQIAGAIGVTRNAVIGKMNRMGLKRPRDVIGKQLAQARAARQKSLKTSSKVNVRRVLQNMRAQQSVPTPAFCEPVPSVDIVPINEGRGRTLLELGPWHCRWPSGTPGAEDFRYCGHEALQGYSYCLGHASMAYRSSRRPHASASR